MAAQSQLSDREGLGRAREVALLDYGHEIRKQLSSSAILPPGLSRRPGGVRGRLSCCGSEPVAQHVDVDREVAAFFGTALVDDANHCAACVEKRAARHALAQLLGHLDQPDGALYRDRADDAWPDVKRIAWSPCGVSNCGRRIADAERRP